MDFPKIWLTLALTAQWSLILAAFLWTCRGIRRLYFHPLAKYPGPKFAAMTDIWHVYHYTGGRWPFVMEEMHRRYGPVVRISPRELVFSTVESYSEIYKYSLKDRSKILIKSAVYANRGAPHIQSERDLDKHAVIRKKLAPAFSIKALRDQEDVIHRYVDILIEQMLKLGKPGGPGIDLRDAFGWLTFDIIGDLTFGESFNSTAEAKTHLWTTIIPEGAYLAALGTMRKRVPALILFVLWKMPKGFMQKRKKLEEISEEKVQRRLKLGNSRGRNDFFGHMFNKQLENEEVSTESIHQDMTANSGILVVGGAETTKAFLIATCQRLMQNPECLKKLTDEVRSKYSSPEEITGQSTASLEYLNAVIEEGLRLFPPLPLGLTRQVPACGTQISGHQIPGGTIVSTIPWVTAHSPKYWHKPTSFIPERWLGEGFGDCKEASQPFSLGPRGCIGINLAYLEMRITLAKMAYHLDWELVTKDIDPVMDSKLYTTWFMSSIRAIFHPKKT